MKVVYNLRTKKHRSDTVHIFDNDKRQIAILPSQIEELVKMLKDTIKFRTIRRGK